MRMMLFTVSDRSEWVYGDRLPVFFPDQLVGLSIEERNQLYIRTWEKFNGRPYDGPPVDMTPRGLP